MEMYLDNSATTKPYPEVVDIMIKSLTEKYGNPSAAHRKGLEIEKDIKDIRRNIARTIGAKEKEIIFTSGGTESNNTVLRSCAEIYGKRKKHIISTKIEHPSVLNTLEYLEKKGYKVTYLEVDEKGMISEDELRNSLSEDTLLVSIMYVNNEVGSVQPIKKLVNIVKEFDNEIIFHTDAVQAYGKLDIKVPSLGIDFMSVSGHKLHGPKGIGFMYIKDGVRINPLVTGGGQESNLRSGTENTPGIYGLGKAVEITFADLKGHISEMERKRNLLKELIEEKIDGLKINSPENGVCHILNISFEDIRGEVLLHYLEQKNVYVSTGSACSSKKKGSHVLNAMRLSQDEIEGAIRFSISEMNADEEIKNAVDILCESVDELRSIIRLRK
ncbi:cysteine desulfurase [Peptacetobacter hominis]|uniref:Cysteine desulfurase n=1 Tax=Peptacetobacter hominis TaxID=2743610 RepID=A0A544QW39_9FIRM|nr:cysteine desulfurase family protein [Peptacetobacter hominis]TQQ84904.1 cysteine desulfurase [Peptacetobacter hominis]